MAKPQRKLHIYQVIWLDGAREWTVTDGFQEEWAPTWPEILVLAEEWIRNG